VAKRAHQSTASTQLSSRRYIRATGYRLTEFNILPAI